MVLLGVETDLSTRTRSSLSRAHLALGHITHTRLPASRSSSWCSAWASWLTVCTHGDEPQPPRPHTSGPHGSDLTSDLTLMLFLSSEPSVRMKASLPSVPSTLRKQLVVCPIPDGRTLSHSMALITELLPLLVLKNGGGNRFHWEADVSRPWVVTTRGVLPPEEDHLHVSARQHLPDAGHLGQVAADLLDLLLCGDWVQLLIFVGIWHTEKVCGSRSGRLTPAERYLPGRTRSP